MLTSKGEITTGASGAGAGDGVVDWAGIAIGRAIITNKRHRSATPLAAWRRLGLVFIRPGVRRTQVRSGWKSIVTESVALLPVDAVVSGFDSQKWIMPRVLAVLAGNPARDDAKVRKENVHLFPSFAGN